MHVTSARLRELVRGVTLCVIRICLDDALPRLSAPPVVQEKLIGHPFFRRYGVNLPSSLTEGCSFTLGEFPLPTCVGLRNGQSCIWLEAFLGSIGVDDFCELSLAGYRRHASVTGICLGHALRAARPSCPFDGFTFLTASPPHSLRYAPVQDFLPAFHRLRL